MKIIRLAAIPLTMVAAIALTAAPAGAGPVLANDRYKWFYWVGPLLMIGAILSDVTGVRSFE